MEEIVTGVVIVAITFIMFWPRRRPPDPPERPRRPQRDSFGRGDTGFGSDEGGLL